MQKTLLFIDRISTWIGQAFSFLILVLTAHVSWEVFSRYALDNPRAWAFDAMIMLYGTLFMMAGAYTLSKNGHVRGDVLYGFFPPRTQATIDLILYIVFFVPGVFALTYAGYYYAADSWHILERSNITSEGPPIYPFKTVIPFAGGILFVQGDRRDHPLRHLPQAGLLAFARAGRGRSRCREAEAGGRRQGRGHREARRLRHQGQDVMKIRREMVFGFGIMALIVIPVLVLTPWSNLFDAHLDKADLGVLGLLMLALIVVAIMLGFPTAFTLMGMGVFFAWLAYRSVNPQTAVNQVLDLFVQRTYGVMSNDVLIAIPLFLFMGYLVERARSSSTASLGACTSPPRACRARSRWATIVTCAIFATAHGNRRRCCDADGPARVSGDAQGLATTSRWPQAP
jgi:TRAP-type mannitol/chloroaromatic compound transport system permease small subunit